MILKQPKKNRPYTATLELLSTRIAEDSKSKTITYSRQEHHSRFWVKKLIGYQQHTSVSVWFALFGLPLWFMLTTGAIVFTSNYAQEFNQPTATFISIASITSLLVFMAVFATPIARGWLESIFCILSKKEKSYARYPLAWLPAPNDIGIDYLFLRTERFNGGYQVRTVSYSAPCSVCTEDPSAVQVYNQKHKKAKKHLGHCAHGHTYSFDFGSLEGKRVAGFDITPVK